MMGEVEKNLKLCIAEKELKTARHRHKYPEWWLILPDHIDFSLEVEDRDVFRKNVATLQHSFDKIVLLDPRDHLPAFVI
jgi:hypothetical protein